METSLADLTKLPSGRVGSLVEQKSFSRPKYLQQLKFASGSSPLITEKVLEQGDFFIYRGQSDVEGLGNNINLLFLGSKPKALDTSDRGNIVESNDMNSAVYKDIKALSTVKDSQCMEGMSYLVFEESTRMCFEFFFMSVSLSRENGKVMESMAISKEDIDSCNITGVDPHGPITLNFTRRYHKDPAKNRAYYVPVVTTSSTPIKLSDSEYSDAVEQIAKFKVLKDDSVEVVDGEERDI